MKSPAPKVATTGAHPVAQLKRQSDHAHRLRMPPGVWSRLAWLCVAGLVLGGCAAQPTITVAPDAWQFERRAIHLQIKADPALNQAYGQAHTLVLGVFQLKDPASFTSLGALREGAL